MGGYRDARTRRGLCTRASENEPGSLEIEEGAAAEVKALLNNYALSVELVYGEYWANLRSWECQLDLLGGLACGRGNWGVALILDSSSFRSFLQIPWKGFYLAPSCVRPQAFTSN